MSIGYIDRTLRRTPTPDQSGYGSNGSEGVLHIVLSSMNGASLSDDLMSYLEHSLKRGFTPLLRCSWCVRQTRPTGLDTRKEMIHLIIINYLSVSYFSLHFSCSLNCIWGWGPAFGALENAKSPHCSHCSLVYSDSEWSFDISLKAASFWSFGISLKAATTAFWLFGISLKAAAATAGWSFATPLKAAAGFWLFSIFLRLLLLLLLSHHSAYLWKLLLLSYHLASLWTLQLLLSDHLASLWRLLLLLLSDNSASLWRLLLLLSDHSTSLWRPLLLLLSDHLASLWRLLLSGS